MTSTPVGRSSSSAPATSRSLAAVYLDVDSPHEVVAFSVSEQYVTGEPLLGREVVPFEEVESRSPQASSRCSSRSASAAQSGARRDLCAGEGQRLRARVIRQLEADTYGGIDIGDNTFIFEENVIQPFVRIGSNVVLWSGNHIGHDSVIEDHCFIASHVVISGNVTIARVHLRRRQRDVPRWHNRCAPQHRRGRGADHEGHGGGSGTRGQGNAAASEEELGAGLLSAVFTAAACSSRRRRRSRGRLSCSATGGRRRGRPGLHPVLLGARRPGSGARRHGRRRRRRRRASRRHRTSPSRCSAPGARGLRRLRRDDLVPRAGRRPRLLHYTGWTLGADGPLLLLRRAGGERRRRRGHSSGCAGAASRAQCRRPVPHRIAVGAARRRPVADVVRLGRRVDEPATRAATAITSAARRATTGRVAHRRPCRARLRARRVRDRRPYVV